MGELFRIEGRNKQEMFQLTKPRFNAYACGHGEIRDQRSKERNRKSKYNQKLRNALRKEYEY